MRVRAGVRADDLCFLICSHQPGCWAASHLRGWGGHGPGTRHVSPPSPFPTLGLKRLSVVWLVLLELLAWVPRRLGGNIPLEIEGPETGRHPFGREQPPLARASVKSSGFSTAVNCRVRKPVAGLASASSGPGEKTWMGRGLQTGHLLPPYPSLERCFVGHLFKGLTRSRPEKSPRERWLCRSHRWVGPPAGPGFPGTVWVSPYSVSWNSFSPGRLGGWPPMARSSHCEFPDSTLRGPRKSFRVTLGCVRMGVCVRRGQMGGALTPCSKQYTSSPKLSGL